MIIQLKKDLFEQSSKDIYRKYLLGQKVWYFSNYFGDENHSIKYDELKYFISEKLDVHFNNVAIVGSAKTGISFNPSKKYKLFDENSDFDIIIVSPKHFNKLWTAYIEMFYRGIPMSEYGEVSKFIFKKFISLKNPTQKHPEIINWLKTVEPLVKDLQLFFGVEQQINYRIYDSWESVENYHYFGIQILKNTVLKNHQREQKITQILSSIINFKNGNNK